MFFCLKILFTFTNSVDPDEMKHSAAFHLCLHCLQKYLVYGVSRYNIGLKYSVCSSIENWKSADEKKNMQNYPACRIKGAQWLSGRVLDSRTRGRGFEPQRRRCVVSLSKTHLSLLSTGKTQEDLSRHN